jgi:PBSX family phage terminase large subunit
MRWLLLILAMISIAEPIQHVIDPVTPEQQLAIEETSPDLLLWGIGGTGKTHIGAEKGIFLGCKYKQNRILLIRHKKTDLRTTLWKKFTELLPNELVSKRNDQTMEITIRNGTEFIGLGLRSEEDINKLASMEAGAAIVEEGTEIPESFYDEKIRRAVRLTRVPFHQTVTLCNPAHPRHWIKKRWLDQKRPGYNDIFFRTLVPYLPETWLEWFNGLEGPFALRYREGQWIAFEGLVYPFNHDRHVVARFEIPQEWKRVVAIDFGFSLMHPFVCLWFAISPKGVWYCYRQIYITGRTVGELAPTIRSFMEEDGIIGQAIICDHDAEDRATLNKRGMKTIPANKQRLAGQRSVHDLIIRDKLMFFEDSLLEEDFELKMHKLPIRTEDEFSLYIWANKEREDMAKKFDHGQDCTRYAVHTTLSRGKPIEDTSRYAPQVIQRNGVA